MGFETVDSHAIGAASTTAGRNGGSAATPSPRQRFKRADHDLHVDELLLELLDALFQAGVGIGLRRRSLRLGLRLRHRLRKLHGLCDDGRREKTREAGAAENGNEESMREQWTT